MNILAWVELAASIHLGLMTSMITVENAKSLWLLKVPLPIFALFLMADALSRLGLLS